jgi:nitrate reductase beta subunit
MHLLLSACGGRPSDGVCRDLRRSTALHRLVLYDADAVTAAASTPNPQDLYEAQLSVLLDPNDRAVQAAASEQGIPDTWLDAARRSPVYSLIKRYRVALPLYPEFRTMPMVWYVPPLSPVVDLLREQGHDAEDHGNLFGAIDALRIPVEYLAGLFTAGDTAPVVTVLQRLAAMRSFMRDITLGGEPDETKAAAGGMTGAAMYEMYRLMAIAKYEDRYVIPEQYASQAHDLEETGCSLDFEGGPGMFESSAFGEASGRPAPVAVETFHALKQRQQSEGIASGRDMTGRVNLLNWDGVGTPEGLFPKPPEPSS